MPTPPLAVDVHCARRRWRRGYTRTTSMPLADIGADNVAKIIQGLAILLVVLVVGFIAVSELRQMIGRKEEPGGPVVGFSLADLREMHRTGRLTDEEFARAKDKVVDAAKKT